MFAIGGWENTGKPAFTSKTSELNFHFLSDKPGYRPAPCLASRGMKWIQQYDLSSDADEELIYYLRQSHHIASSGLSKKKPKVLGLNIS